MVSLFGDIRVLLITLNVNVKNRRISGGSRCPWWGSFVEKFLTSIDRIPPKVGVDVKGPQGTFLAQVDDLKRDSLVVVEACKQYMG